jgi:hypothetical protein
VYPFGVFLSLLLAPSPQAGVPLIDDCSDSATVIATLAADAPVEVRSSIAGGAQACYAVTATVNGKPVRGYVLGNGLKAIAEFERQRAAAAVVQEALPPAAPETAVATPPPPPPVEKPHYPPFANFSAPDMKGRAVSVHGMKGKINLVCFWSPGNANSARELLLVAGLQGEFHQQGVDALAISLSGKTRELVESLDDYHLKFPNVPGGTDIAARYNIDYTVLPRTYVLNENFEIIASGLHNKALENLVKKLLTEK